MNFQRYSKYLSRPTQSISRVKPHFFNQCDQDLLDSFADSPKESFPSLRLIFRLKTDAGILDTNNDLVCSCNCIRFNDDVSEAFDLITSEHLETKAV